MNHVFFYVTWMARCVCHLENTRMYFGKKAEVEPCEQFHALGNVLLGNLGSCYPHGCYLDAYLSIIADHVQLSWKWYSLMAVASFSSLMGHVTKHKMVQEWSEEHNNEFEVLTWRL